MHDLTRQLCLIKVPAFYVPKCNVRLLSTTSLLQTYNNETILIEKHQLTLSGISGNPTKGAVTALVNPTNNLPTSITYRYNDVPIATQALTTTISEVEINNRNLSEPEKELLRWHYRLGHIGYRKVQFLMRTGVLGRSEAQRRLHSACCRLTSPPLCAACQFGRQKRRPSPRKQSSVVKDKEDNLKRVISYLGNALLLITLFAAPKVGCSLWQERQRKMRCTQVDACLSTTQQVTYMLSFRLT